MSGERRSILCPNCNKLISQDEASCPYCGVHAPGSWWKNNAVVRGILREENFLLGLMGVNVLFYLIALALDPEGLSKSFQQGSLLHWLSPSNKSLLALGATGRYPIDVLGAWWSLVSANYLHGGLLHIAFNVSAIWSLGPILLKEYGMHRSFAIYSLGGMFGFFVSYLAKVQYTVGASAAVCAWIGAILYYGYDRNGSYGKDLFRQAMNWIVGMVLFGFLAPGINHWAHGAGVFGGFVLGMLLTYKEKSPDTLAHRGLSGVVFLGTFVVLCWSVFSALWQVIPTN